jgi:hypothetical protein
VSVFPYRSQYFNFKTSQWFSVKFGKKIIKCDVYEVCTEFKETK